MHNEIRIKIMSFVTYFAIGDLLIADEKKI
jgi:hypothetical protein